MKRKFLVIGYLGFVTNQLDGQTIKTRNIYELLRSKSENFYSVSHFDTQEFQKNKLLIFKMVWRILMCDELIYLPGENNLKFLFPIIFFFCKLKRIDILYFVIGGWLAEFLRHKKLHVFFLKKIKGIFAESEQLTNKLENSYQFHNISTFPNFRMHKFVPSFRNNHNTFKIVYMSRVTRMKGIDAVFRLAKHMEERYKKEASISIDFFGPIEKLDEGYFKEQVGKYQMVTYRGALEPEHINSTLDVYDLFVLPTKYSGEGFPGAILDAYISGLPVIVSNWKYLPEFVDVGKTGYIFDLDKEEQFYDYVEKLYLDRDLLLTMKHNAFEKSKMYTAEVAWEILEAYLF